MSLTFSLSKTTTNHITVLLSDTIKFTGLGSYSCKRMEHKKETMELDSATSKGDGAGIKHEASFKGIVRLATIDDLDAIMDIDDDVYAGCDYMPAMFYIFMHSKLHKMYVYEKDGKLITLANFCLYPDEDHFASALSGRVRQSSQGLGIFRLKTNPVIAEFLKDYPRVTRMGAATLLKPNIQAKLQVWKAFYISNFLRYNISDRPRLQRYLKLNYNATGFHQPVNISYTEGIRWITKSDQLMKFLSKYSTEYIPSGPAWMPIRGNWSGLRDIFSSNNAFVTFDRSSTSPNTSAKTSANTSAKTSANTSAKTSANAETLEQTREYEGGENEIAGFSYSTIIPCKYGPVINVNFFGDYEDVLISHVRSHLLHYVNVTQSDVKLGFGLHFPQAIDVHNVEARLQEGLGSSLKADLNNVTQVVYYWGEEDLPRAKL